MILIYATLPIDPDSRDEALEAIADLAEVSRAEEGVIDYRAATEVGQPDLVRFVEQYEDEDAVGAHVSSGHYQAFAADVPQFLAGEPELLRFEVESVSEVEV